MFCFFPITDINFCSQSLTMNNSAENHHIVQCLELSVYIVHNKIYIVIFKEQKISNIVTTSCEWECSRVFAGLSK